MLSVKDKTFFNNDMHIVPRGAKNKHILSSKCACCPEVDKETPGLFIHKTDNGDVLCQDK